MLVPICRLLMGESSPDLGKPDAGRHTYDLVGSGGLLSHSVQVRGNLLFCGMHLHCITSANIIITLPTERISFGSQHKDVL